MEIYLKIFRKKIGLSQAVLGEKIGVDANTVWRWENNKVMPSVRIISKLCSVLGVTEAELLNGPAEREIEVRIVIRETDEEVGNVTMDMSKDAPFLQLVEIAPHKTGLNLVFGPEKSLREVCEELLANESKLEAARAAVYGA